MQLPASHLSLATQETRVDPALCVTQFAALGLLVVLRRWHVSDVTLLIELRLLEVGFERVAEGYV